MASYSVKLNDAATWEKLSPGQFAVFLSNPRTDVLLDGDGKTAEDGTFIPVFDGMEEAERYAEQIVVRMPQVCAAIYDHRGRSGDPVRRIYHESIRKRFDPVRSAHRNAWAGGCLVLAFIVWAIIAAFRSEEHFLWFYILGMKLLTLGTILFVRGMGFFLGRSRRP